MSTTAAAGEHEAGDGGEQQHHDAGGGHPQAGLHDGLAQPVARPVARCRAQSQRATLGTADLRLLWMLSDQPPLALREIVEQLGLEQYTVNRQVNAAIKAGLLARSRAEGSGPYLLSPTRYGKMRFLENCAVTLGAYAQALEGLGDDRGVFLHLLSEFVSGLSEAG